MISFGNVEGASVESLKYLAHPSPRQGSPTLPTRTLYIRYAAGKNHIWSLSTGKDLCVEYHWFK